MSHGRLNPTVNSLVFELPPQITRADGKTRRAGLEIEMHGMAPARVAELVRDLFGGTIERVNPYVYKVESKDLGTFRVELDARFLTELAYHELLEKAGVASGSRTAEAVDDLVREVSEQWVPCEVVCPPIAVTDLSQLLALEEVLRWEGALGSNASLFHALGFQINAEVPDLETATLLAYLRAFLESYAWLEKEVDVDLARRITSYVAPFPEDYVKKVLDPDYEPDQAGLIDDYLRYNPTRNRALDMLPVFAHLDEARVMAKAKEPELIKARPALHYRLPSCRLDEPSWSMALEWNRWLKVEQRAQHWLAPRAKS